MGVVISQPLTRISGGGGSVVVSPATGAVSVTPAGGQAVALPSGAVINFGSGDVTITHSADALAFAGAANGYTFDAPVSATRLTLTAAASIIVPGATSLSVRNNANTADNLLLTDAGAATFRNNVALSAASVTFTIGTSGPTFDAGVTTAARLSTKLVTGFKIWDVYTATTGTDSRLQIVDSAGNAIAQFFGDKTTTLAGALTVSAGGAAITGQSTIYGAGTAGIKLFTSGGLYLGSSAGPSDPGANSFTMDGALKLAGIGTTASAANAYIDNASANNVLRSTSSLRYKDVHGPLTLDEARKIVFGLLPIKYGSKAPADDPTREFVGLGAEHVAAVDDRYVTRTPNGEPDWVQYQALVAPMALVLQDHNARLAALEQRLLVGSRSGLRG